MHTTIAPSGLVNSSTPCSESRLTLWSLIPFLVITFAITWGILGLYMLWPDAITGQFGQLSGQHPLFYIAVYAPAIAAFMLILFRTGPGGLIRFCSRIFLWRCSWSWYAFLIFGVPLVFCAGAAIKGNLLEDGLAFTTMPALLAASFMMLIKGPVEEFGWRGFALPLLQRRLAPIWAGLVIGLIWGLWHLPAFLLSGMPQSAWSFTPFFIGSVALSVIVTPLFNQSRGSILLPVIFHFQLINPLWPDAQPYDTYVFIAVALVIVWLNRRTMFARNHAVTKVLQHTRTEHKS
jgi:hypothetical protein